MTTRRSFLASLTAGFLVPLLHTGSKFAKVTELLSEAGDWPGDSDPRYWEKLRRQFLLREDEVFFNTGTLGSPPRMVIDAVTQNMRHLAATMAEWDYKPGHPNWFTGYYAEIPLREELAKLVNAEVDEIALTQNATMGMNFIAHGLDLSSGDEVLQTDQEHPGGQCGWLLRAKRQGIVQKTVKIPVPPSSPEEIVELVKAAITPRTKVIAWPHITSMLGIVMPVKAICALARERGIFTVLDGAQAVGQIPVDLKDLGCDAYFSSPHKWLLAPAGNGFLYVRRDVAKKVWTTLASSEWDNQTDPGFRLQQRGTGNLSLLVGLQAAIDFYNRVGPERWTARVKELGDYLRAGLQKIDGVTIYSPTHPALCAGMTTWKIRGLTGDEMQDIFWQKGKLRPRSMGADYGVRQCTHIYNTEKDIDRSLAIAREMARRG